MSPNYPSNYGNDQSCDVAVSGSGTVSAEDFDTEFGMDTLTIGVDAFSGAHRPDTVSVEEGSDMTWTSDYSDTASGWKICADSSPASGGGGSASLVVSAGQCTVEGSCASSPNFPEHYGSDEHCTISVTGGNGLISSEAFDTEASFDQLTIGGSDRYSGRDGPQGVYISGGEDIIWHSDYSIQGDGWRFCVADVPPPQAPSGVFSVVSGQCVLNGNCVQSPRFPRNYGNDDDCRVRVEQAGTLRDEVFHLEDYGYDYVSVGGTHYSGDQGPAGMYVLDGMHLGFHSDSSNTFTGFSICLQPEAAEHVTPQPGPEGIKTLGDVYCEHGCGNLTMVGSPTGYVITHSSPSDASEGAVVRIAGQCQAVFTRVNLAGGTLRLDGQAVEGPTSRLLGPGNHTLVWVGGGEEGSAEWLAMIMPTRGGCSEFSSGFDRSCNAGNGRTHKIFHTQSLDDKDRCLRQCSAYATSSLEQLCCQFGFRGEKLGCYAIAGGDISKEGLGHAALCSPQTPALGETGPSLMASHIEAWAARMEMNLAAAEPRPKVVPGPQPTKAPFAAIRDARAPALGAVALLASWSAFVALAVSKRAVGRDHGTDPLLSGA